MSNYASFFVPAKRRSGATGAINIQALAPSSTKKVTQVAPNLVQWNPQPVSSGVAGRILDLGPVGIIGVVAATALVGYLIVTKVAK